MLKITVVLVLLAMGFPAQVLSALLPWGPTAAEKALLPPYCNARNAQEKAYWKKRLGKGSGHMHHYCAGLNIINRVNRGVVNRDHALKSAIKEINYTLDRAGPKFILRSDGYLNIGRIFKQMGDRGKAAGQFIQAINANPKHPAAYVALSDLYRDLGDMKNQRKILEKGIKKAPKSKALKRRLKKLNKASK